MGSDDDLSVVLCSDFLPPGGGGVEVVIETLACRLAEQGVEVSVVTLGRNDGTEHSLVANPEIDVYEVPKIDLTNLVGLQSQIAPSVLTRFGRITKRIDPDVIHLHNRFFFTTLAGAAWTLARRLDVPLVTSLHVGSIDSIDGLAGSAARVYERTIGRLICRESDAVIAVSDAVADHAHRLGADRSKLHTIPNGVDPDLFAPPDERTAGKRLLFVGRLVQNKGPHFFVESLPAVLAAHPDATVRIVGTGPMRADLEARVERLGIGANVRFSGFVDSVADAMGESDVFCRPSLSEGMPLTLLEAMSSGLAPVVTPVAGVPEVVSDGETGVLVPEADPEALAEALSGLFDDQERTTAIGRAARQHVLANHGWDRRTEAVSAVYRQVAGVPRSEMPQTARAD